MLFKRVRAFLPALIALALTAAFAGCALNEGPAADKKRDIKDGDGCLQNFRMQIELYFDGKLEDQQIDALSRCVTGAIDRFQFVVKGKTRETFTATEIRDFLQYYYLEDLVVTDSLLAEIMRVKLALLGGASEKFTFEDLGRAKGMIHTFATQLKLLRPYMPLTPDSMQKAPLAHVEGAIIALRTVAGNLASGVLSRDPGYSLTDLDRLLSEIETTFPSATSIALLRKKIPMAASVKEAFLGSAANPHQITDEDWKVLLQDGVEWIGAGIRMLHFHENHREDMFRGEGRERLAVIVNDIFKLLERIPARHSYRHCGKGASGEEIRCQTIHGVLSFQLIFKVIDESAWNGEVLGRKLSPKTIKAELVPLVQRLLGGTDSGLKGRRAPGLSVEALERARLAFNEWNEGARYLEGLYQKLSGDPKFEKTIGFSAQQLSRVQVQEALQFTGAITPFADRIARDLRNVIVNPKDSDRHPGAGPAFHIDESGRVHFDHDMLTRPKTYADLINYAWMRPLFRLIMHGYIGTTPAEIQKRTRNMTTLAMKEHEFIRLVADVWPVLQDFQYVGKANSPSLDGAKRFMEANLFGFAANGDDEIDLNEAAHLLVFLISTSSVAGDLMEFALQNCESGQPDEFGRKTIEAACFRKNIFNLDPDSSPVAGHYRTFPHLTKYFVSLSAQERESFIRKIETPILSPDGNDGFDKMEVDAYVMLLHYVEALYMRFDTQGDGGTINYPESMNALKIFKRTLGKFAHMDPNGGKLRAVFTWLLTRGKPPEKSEYGEFAMWWLKKGEIGGIFKKDSRRWVYECERSKVVSVFGSITSMAGDGASDALKADKKLRAEDPWREFIPDWDAVPTEAGN